MSSSGIDMSNTKCEATQNTAPSKPKEKKIRKQYKRAEFTFPEALPFKLLVSAVKLVSEEPWLILSDNGIEFKMLDPSHVSLVHVVLPKNMFYKYEMQKKPKSFSINLRIKDLESIAKRVGDKDEVKIKIDTSEKREPPVTVVARGSRVKQFSIHELEGDYNPTPMPKLQFDTKLSILRKALLDILNDIASTSDTVTITTIPREKVVFYGEGEDGKVQITMDRRDVDLLEMTCKSSKPTIATYNIDYLQSALKAIPIDTLIMEYSTKLPIRLTFKLSEYGGSLEYWLAPRIEK